MTIILLVITLALAGMNYIFIFMKPSKNSKNAVSKQRPNAVLRFISEVWCFYEFGARPIHGIKFILPFFPVYMKMFNLSFLDLILLFFDLVFFVIGIGVLIDRLDLINYLNDQHFARYGNMREEITRGNRIE